MARFRHLFAFAVVDTVWALGCLEAGCLEEEDAALSLLQASARVVHSAHDRINTTSPVARVTGEIAFLNIIRHGEKCADDLGPDGDGLTAVGFERAAYLGRCMSSDAASVAMPFGKASAVMAGAGPPPSVRPKDTLTPLSEKLGLPLHMPCKSPVDQDCLAKNALKYLKDKGTLVVAWTYQMLPYLTADLGVPDLPREYDVWPLACPSETFIEPACCSKVVTAALGPPWNLPYEPTSICFDAIWQVRFTRPNGDSEWKPQSITTLAEGFGGSSDSPCAQDLAPFIVPLEPDAKADA